MKYGYIHRKWYTIHSKYDYIHRKLYTIHGKCLSIQRNPYSIHIKCNPTHGKRYVVHTNTLWSKQLYLIESTMLVTGRWRASFIQALKDSATFEYISHHRIPWNKKFDQWSTSDFCSTHACASADKHASSSSASLKSFEVYAYAIFTITAQHCIRIALPRLEFVFMKFASKYRRQ